MFMNGILLFSVADVCIFASSRGVWRTSGFVFSAVLRFSSFLVVSGLFRTCFDTLHNLLPSYPV